MMTEFERSKNQLLSLMKIIEVIIHKGNRGEIALNNDCYKLYESAKQIYSADSSMKMIKAINDLEELIKIKPPINPHKAIDATSAIPTDINRITCSRSPTGDCHDCESQEECNEKDNPEVIHKRTAQGGKNPNFKQAPL